MRRSLLCHVMNQMQGTCTPTPNPRSLEPKPLASLPGPAYQVEAAQAFLPGCARLDRNSGACTGIIQRPEEAKWGFGHNILGLVGDVSICGLH